MISTAVIVGEMSATDWANRAGNPKTLVRSPTCFFAVAIEGELRVNVTAVTSPCVWSPYG